MNGSKTGLETRDQIFHLLVLWKRLLSDLPKRNRTAGLKQLLDIVQDVLSQAAIACEEGEIMAVQIDRYVQVELPGFDEDGWSMKSPHDIDGD